MQSSVLPFSSVYDRAGNGIRYGKSGHYAETFKDLKYDLRPSPRLFATWSTTWLDQDESGDFDPDQKEPVKKPFVPAKRERPIRRDAVARNPNAKRLRLDSWQLGRRNGLSCPVIIKLRTERGFHLLQYLRRFEDNWPEHKPDEEIHQQNFTELSEKSVQPHRLRQRRQQATNLASIRLEDPDMPSLSEVTLGHPAARGCKGCFQFNSPCSLLQEGEKYPCLGCREDDIECELIIPPVRKRPCESCRARKIVCSYRITEDHSEPCRDCANSGIKCIAGPLTGRTRTGPSLDQDPKFFTPTPDRPYKSCTGCRKVKKYCSLIASPGYGNCTRCDELGQKCTFEAIAKKPKKQVKEKKATPQEEPASTTESNDVPLPAPASTTPITKTITTRLAHPILLNHSPSPSGLDPCNWCLSPTYGIIGLPPVSVLVLLPWQNSPSGYTELSGGHTAAGIPPSRICSACTLSRLRICACARHEVVPLAGTEATDGEAGTQGWEGECCSLCCRGAGFGCAAEGEVGGEGEVGCGLRLCEGCAGRLVEEHGGRLDGLVGELDGSEGLEGRADVGFLHSRGELVRRIRWGA